MLTGLNSYNSSVQYNNRPRFGQLTTNAAREMWKGVQRYCTDGGDVTKFNTNFITGATDPAVLREVAEHAENTGHRAAQALKKMASSLLV